MKPTRRLLYRLAIIAFSPILLLVALYLWLRDKAQTGHEPK